MRIILFLVIFILCGCRGVFHSRPSEKVRLAHEIRSQTAEKLKNEMGLIPFGFGGQMMYQIQMLELTFQYRHPVDIEEGREILIQATKKFLNEINHNEKVRPYLSDYPFEPKNVTIWILLQKSDGSTVEPGQLCFLISEDGLLKYETHDIDTKQLTTLHKETYEEACEKLKMDLSF